MIRMEWIVDCVRSSDTVDEAYRKIASKSSTFYMIKSGGNICGIFCVRGGDGYIVKVSARNVYIQPVSCEFIEDLFGGGDGVV